MDTAGEPAADRPLRNAPDALRRRGLGFPAGLGDDSFALTARENRDLPSRYHSHRAGQLRDAPADEASHRQAVAANEEVPAWAVGRSDAVLHR